MNDVKVSNFLNRVKLPKSFIAVNLSDKHIAPQAEEEEGSS